MRKNCRVLLFAASVTVLQLATAAQSDASSVYAAEMSESSNEIMESSASGSNIVAPDGYIALIAEAAQQATVNNPIYPSLLMAYSMHYTEMGTTLGAQEGSICRLLTKYCPRLLVMISAASLKTSIWHQKTI